MTTPYDPDELARGIRQIVAASEAMVEASERLAAGMNEALLGVQEMVRGV